MIWLPNSRAIPKLLQQRCSITSKDIEIMEEMQLRLTKMPPTPSGKAFAKSVVSPFLVTKRSFTICKEESQINMRLRTWCLNILTVMMTNMAP